MKYKIIYKALIMVCLFLLIPMVSSETSPPKISFTTLATSCNGGCNSSFNQTLSDLLYWRLDGTNDPPTSNWNMGGYDFLLGQSPGVSGTLRTNYISDMAGSSVMITVWNPLTGDMEFGQFHGAHAVFDMHVDVLQKLNFKGNFYGNNNWTFVKSGDDLTLSSDAIGNFIINDSIIAPNICYSNGSQCNETLSLTYNSTYANWAYNQTYTGAIGWRPNNATENNNYTTTGNVTSNYGFFSYLGSLASRITKGWFTDLDATNINATNINATNYRDRNNVLLGGTIFTQNNTVGFASSGISIVTGSLLGTGKGNLTLPANFCSSEDSGKTIRLTAYGIFTTPAISPTAKFVVYLNQTIISQTATITPTKSLTNQGWSAESIITCRTTGTTGTVFGQGLVTMATSTVDGQLIFMPTNTTATIDTTSPQPIDFKITWGQGGGAFINSTNVVVESLN